MKKILASSLAIMLAGSFTFSSGAAFANEEDQNVVDIVTTVTPVADEATNTDGELADETNQAEETEEDAPALVPGDFFYFVKTTFEKIQLALTINDVKEAKLLAEFSAERIAEAQSLIADGEDELAAKVMKEALETLEEAQFSIEDETSADEESTDEDTQTEDDATDEENADEETDEVADEDSDGLEEVHKVMSQNIIALTAAMNKVKNPVAKAALQKNIDKAYEKLEKKLAKFGYEADEDQLDEATEEELENTNEETNDQVTDVDNETEVDTETNEEIEVDSTDSETDATVIPAAKVKEKKEKIKKQDNKHQQKQNHKKAHKQHDSKEKHGKHGEKNNK